MLLGISAWSFGQAVNPFELTERLELPAADSMVAPAATGNPFDIVRTAAADRPRPARGAADGPLIVRATDPDQGRGSLLAIHLILLLVLAAIWLLFGDTLQQALRGAFSDNLLTQLYTRRSGGAMFALWLGYVFFFFATGFYIYLLTQHYDVGVPGGILGGWLTFSLVVAAALGLRAMVLRFFAGVFPVQKEMGRYLFGVMIFAVLAGLLIAPVNLMISYAPQDWRTVFLYGGIVVLGVVYLLHLLRGVFIVGPLLARRPLHILLYLCVIEIAPVLLVYRYLTDTLA